MQNTTMQDFESKEYRNYVNKELLDPTLGTELDMMLDLANVQIADIEINSDLMLAIHRC